MRRPGNPDPRRGAGTPFTDGTMTVNSPLWIEGQKKLKPRRAPAVGEHSDRSCVKLGRSEAEIGGVTIYDLQPDDLLPLARRPGRAPVSEPFSNTGVPATRVAR
jgi:hypothetical protein